MIVYTTEMCPPQQFTLRTDAGTNQLLLALSGGILAVYVF